MGSTRSNGFINRIPVVNMFDRGVTDQFAPQWYDKGVLIVDFFYESQLRTFGSNGGIHRLFVTRSLCGFQWRRRGLSRGMTQRGRYRWYHGRGLVGDRPRKRRRHYKWYTRHDQDRVENER